MLRRASIMLVGCFSHAMRLHTKRVLLWLPPFCRCSLAQNPALTPQPFERGAHLGVGHGNLISYTVSAHGLHFDGVAQHNTTANAIDPLRMPRLLRPGAVSSSVWLAPVGSCLRPGEVSAPTGCPSIGTGLVTTSVMKSGTSFLARTQSQGPLDSNISDYSRLWYHR